MQDRLVKSPETRQKTVVGIWLMFMTPDNKIFVVTNNEPKYLSQKIPGQINSPAESYDATKDQGNFKNGTIARAIKEEVGDVEYIPSDVKPLGLISFNGLDNKVVAAPYLIPVKSEAAISYNPQDPNEGSNPRWVNLDEIQKGDTLKVGQYSAPLYRSPMVEIAEMIRNYQESGMLQIRHVEVSVPKEVYKNLY